MSDLQRLQQLAEAVGWKIEDSAVGIRYRLTTTKGTYITTNNDLAPIRARIEAEYRKLANDVKRQMVILEATGYLMNVRDHRANHFTRIADELAAMKEPTMVEKDIAMLADIASPDTNYPSYEKTIARIMLTLYQANYERKEK